VTLWREANFDDSAGQPGRDQVGDSDEATVLDDMRKVDEPGRRADPGYASFFVRKTFDVADQAIVNLVLDVEYDDSCRGLSQRRRGGHGQPERRPRSLARVSPKER
jgi:hypothetical protein